MSIFTQDRFKKNLLDFGFFDLSCKLKDLSFRSNKGIEAGYIFESLLPCEQLLG
jgi:hypothetical protein